MGDGELADEQEDASFVLAYSSADCDADAKALCVLPVWEENPDDGSTRKN